MGMQEQIEYLRKISKNQASVQDLENYIKLLVEDNCFDLGRTPSQITFDEEPTDGYYLHNLRKINISKHTLEKGVSGQLFNVINTLGHEWRHFLQHTFDINKITDKKAKEYYQTILDAQEAPYELPADLNNFEEILYTYSSKFLQHLKEKNQGETKTADFSVLESYVQKINSFTLAKAKHSYYLQHMHEEDARLGGVVFTEYLFNKYKAYFQETQDNELLEFINDQLSKNEKLREQLAEDKNNYSGYQELKKVFENLSYDMIFEIFKSQEKSKDDMKVSAIYLAFLESYTNEFVQNCDPSELETIFLLHTETFKKQDKQKNAKMMDLSAIILEKLAISNIPTERKEFFANVVYKHIYKNVKTYNFSQKDQMISQLYINGLLTNDQMIKLLKKMTYYEKDQEFAEITLMDNLKAKRFVDNDQAAVRIVKCFNAGVSVCEGCFDELTQNDKITAKQIENFNQMLKRKSLSIRSLVSCSELMIPENFIKDWDKKINSLRKNSSVLLMKTLADESYQNKNQIQDFTSEEINKLHNLNKICEEYTEEESVDKKLLHEANESYQKYVLLMLNKACETINSNEVLQEKLTNIQAIFDSVWNMYFNKKLNLPKEEKDKVIDKLNKGYDKLNAILGVNIDLPETLDVDEFI